MKAEFHTSERLPQAQRRNWLDWRGNVALCNPAMEKMRKKVCVTTEKQPLRCCLPLTQVLWMLAGVTVLTRDRQPPIVPNVNEILLAEASPCVLSTASIHLSARRRLIAPRSHRRNRAQQVPRHHSAANRLRGTIVFHQQHPS